MKCSLAAAAAAAATAKSLQLCPTLRPHRQQPTRLSRPWDSPGKNTGVGCHCFLQCRKVKSESEVAESCPTLNDPMDCGPPGSSIHGIFQARVLEWGAIAFSGNVPLVSLIFLKRSLVFPILLFSSISLLWSPLKTFLCLLAILWNSAFRWVCFSFSPLPFASLLFSAFCKGSSDNHFDFLHFFLFGMVLITASYTMSWTSVHSSSGTLSIRSYVLIFSCENAKIATCCWTTTNKRMLDPTKKRYPTSKGKGEAPVSW